MTDLLETFGVKPLGEDDADSDTHLIDEVLERAAQVCDHQRDSGWEKDTAQYQMANLLGAQIRSLKGVLG